MEKKWTKRINICKKRVYQPASTVPALGCSTFRCLAILLDLDETLIIANTKESFEDRIEPLSCRIETLSCRIDGENDPVHVSGMSTELKRYIEDTNMLKQYIENDVVLDNGKLVAAQNEQVTLLPGSQEHVFQPVIRLQ